MTLDEAIVHADEKGRGESPCAEEHRQLAAWLEELRDLRERQAGMPLPPLPSARSVLFWRRVHNLVAHPLMEALPGPWGDWLHDTTAALAFIDQGPG